MTENLINLILKFTIEDIDHWFPAPVERGMLDEAERNPPEFLRNKASRVTGAISPYIRRYETILKSINPKIPLIFDEHKRSFIDGFKCLTPQFNRYLHIDLAKNRDSVGFCMCHVPYYDKIQGTSSKNKAQEYTLPHFIIDMMARITPQDNEDIEISDIDYMVYDLADLLMYPIKLVTFDGFQSLHSMQNLRAHGIISAHLSIDRTTSRVKVDYDTDRGYTLESTRGDHMAAYSSLRNAMYEGRIEVPPHPKWEEELQQQEEIGGRVKKVANGEDDLVQSVAGAVFNAESNEVEYIPDQNYAEDLKQKMENRFRENIDRDLDGMTALENESREERFYSDLREDI